VNWQAEQYRELEEKVQGMIAALPRRPRLWREEEAVTEYIMSVMDVHDFIDANLQAIDTADDPPGRIEKMLMNVITHPSTPEELEREAIDRAIKDYKAGDYEPLRDAFRYGKLRYGMARYREGLELLIKKGKNTFKSPRKPGLLPTPMAEKRSRNLLPEAEDDFCGICGLLCDLFPEQEGKHIYDLGRKLTVVRLDRLLGEHTVTAKKLDWFIKLGPNDPRRLGKPKTKLELHLKHRRQRISVSLYLSFR
jgi:hypothetical protein